MDGMGFFVLVVAMPNALDQRLVKNQRKEWKTWVVLYLVAGLGALWRSWKIFGVESSSIGFHFQGNEVIEANHSRIIHIVAISCLYNRLPGHLAAREDSQN